VSKKKAIVGLVLTLFTRVEGTVSTAVPRAAYNLIIPTVRDGGDVEEVELYLDFVANAS
jgi:hypothetical protein